MELKPWVEWLHKKRVLHYATITGVLLILLLLFASYLMSAFLIGMAVLAAVLVNAFGLRQSGFELITLATVLFGMAFGPKTGAIVGLVLVLLQITVGGYINIYVLWVVPGYVLAGFVAGLLQGMEVSTVGMWITLGLNFFFMTFTMLFTPGALGRYIPYAALNIMINFILFTIVAPSILNVMV